MVLYVLTEDTEDLITKYNITICDEFPAIICKTCKYMVSNDSLYYHLSQKHKFTIKKNDLMELKASLPSKNLIPLEYTSPTNTLLPPIKCIFYDLIKDIKILNGYKCRFCEIHYCSSKPRYQAHLREIHPDSPAIDVSQDGIKVQTLYQSPKDRQYFAVFVEEALVSQSYRTNPEFVKMLRDNTTIVYSNPHCYTNDSRRNDIFQHRLGYTSYYQSISNIDDLTKDGEEAARLLPHVIAFVEKCNQLIETSNFMTRTFFSRFGETYLKGLQNTSSINEYSRDFTKSVMFIIRKAKNTEYYDGFYMPDSVLNVATRLDRLDLQNDTSSNQAKEYFEEIINLLLKQRYFLVNT